MSKIKALLGSIQNDNQAFNRRNVLHLELLMVNDLLQIHNIEEDQNKDMDFLSYLQLKQTRKQKIVVGGVDTFSDYAQQQYRRIQEAIEAACKNNNIWKVEFCLDSDYYFRLAPKSTNPLKCWSPASEAKLRALCPKYDQECETRPINKGNEDRKGNEGNGGNEDNESNETRFFVDQSNMIPVSWYVSSPTQDVFDRLEMYWNENKLYFADQTYIDKMDQLITYRKLPQRDIYESIIVIDPKREFFNLVQIRAIFTQQQILAALVDV